MKTSGKKQMQAPMRPEGLHLLYALTARSTNSSGSLVVGVPSGGSDPRTSTDQDQHGKKEVLSMISTMPRARSS